MTSALTVAADPANGRTVLTLTWDGALPPSISRFDPDGTWRWVRGAHPAAVVAGTWTGSDFEAPVDAAFHYAVQDSSGGTPVLSEVLLAPSNAIAWLKHPALPEYNIRLALTELPDLTRTTNQGIFGVLGRAYPVAVTMPGQAPTGTLRFFTDTPTERLAVVRVLADGGVRVLAVPGGMGLGTVWVAPGTLLESRLTAYGPEAARLWELPFTVVDRPA